LAPAGCWWRYASLVETLPRKPHYVRLRFREEKGVSVDG